MIHDTQRAQILQKQDRSMTTYITLLAQLFENFFSFSPFPLNLFIYFINFFVVVICYLDLLQDFYGHEAGVF